MRIVAPLLLIVLGAGALRPAEAQWSLGAGAMAVEYSEVDPLGGAQFGPSFRLIRPTLFVEVGGNGARFGDGTWSGDGGGVAAWRPLSFGSFEPELIGSLSGGGANGTDFTSAIGTQLRLHRPIGAGSFFVGGGGVWSNGVAGRQTTSSFEIGGTASFRGIEATATAAPSRVAGTRYTDLSVFLRREGRLTLEFSGGHRTVGGGDPESWIGGSAELGIGGPLTVVASAGGFPSDVAQGFPGGRYLTLGMRVGGRHRSALPTRDVPRISRPLPWPGASLAVRDLGEGRRQLIVAAPGAVLVEVAGDFSDWEPVALTRDGRLWKVELTLPAGIHKINIRIDGGAWRVPPGTVPSADEFGGEVGLLTVD
jgi:hypothetical protein